HCTTLNWLTQYIVRTSKHIQLHSSRTCFINVKYFTISCFQLIRVNQPDLVLFVGEALVGNEAVDQLTKFNKALIDHSASENPRVIDGIILTKFDTIDDKVGAAISMTYTTGQPIVFVGTGQTYTDLRNLNAKAVVSSLLK
ncbi:signal recognition particle receptor subunit alpha homolog, partial [Pecten maximus]|uniref:signal recognition particle receptor subunit alpha homolog n=1 Tax=Pecten maximus TaxID=6579 RepID=UPI0014587543